MKVPSIKFNLQDRPEFIQELRKNVNDYFKNNNISKYANINMKLKTAFMVGLYFIPLGLLISGVVSTLWPVILMWVLMGFGMSGIGLSVMHDAIHGSYSKNQKVNNALGFLIHFIGGYNYNWKIQHNVLHHSFTNVDGLDQDIANPVMRFSPTQKRRKIFRFQAFYAPFLYSLMTVHWFTSKDFTDILKFHKKNLLAGQGLTLKKAMLQIISIKVLYVGLILVLPLVMIALPWWQILIGFLIMHFICGLALSFIFQAAHVLSETDFYDADLDDKLENSWAIHQMRTTANFANRSVLFTWFIGALNFQIEHHLFPNICHVHYKNISKIVKETAKEFNVPYYQHRTFFGALKSHFSLLNRLGMAR